MLIDYVAYLKTRFRRSLITNKLVAMVTIAAVNVVCLIVPVFAADNGLAISRDSKNPHPILSLSEAFRNAGLGDVDFIRCLYHVKDNILPSLKVDFFETDGVRINLNLIEENLQQITMHLSKLGRKWLII